jgi:hypothetical protein
MTKKNVTFCGLDGSQCMSWQRAHHRWNLFTCGAKCTSLTQGTKIPLLDNKPKE